MKMLENSKGSKNKYLSAKKQNKIVFSYNIEKTC